MSKESISTRYNPSEIEDKIYSIWLEKGYFAARPKSNAPKFSIMIPPPNITGVLTLGHVLNNTLQDIVVRWKRMQGYDVLWQPGIDHAGIATQNVVEKALAKEGKSRFDVGREEFLKRVWDWKEKYGNTILLQLRKLGVSCDWSRVKFTMDPDLSRAVIRAFVQLFKEGLIYRGTRIINWCPRCGTALADDEVEYVQRKGKLYYIKYPLVGENRNVVVATTRPETYLGDTAVAINPEDEIYKNLKGKRVRLPLINWKRVDYNGHTISEEIPVVESKRVELGFGTGVVKVTPAHDPVDFEIGEEHGLPQVQVMDSKAFMNENAGIFAGLTREEAREKVVKALEEAGYIEKIEDYSHNVGTCYRCNTVIEPYLSPQWFVKMKPLAERAYQVVKDSEIKIIPNQFEKIYFNWLENVKDWCISRQIWWGHRIPVYVCEDCGNLMVNEEEVKVCDKCGSSKIKQDEDVLDTWFSSWLWPFSTLGWPEETEYLKKYYPTDLLITGWDILFFWVARMIMAGYFFMKDKPFHRVYLHGLIRDEKRRKLSKSLGNSPDPLDLISKYGADGVRMGLMLITPEGQDVIYSEKKMEIGRNFANKLWNASRLLFMNLADGKRFPLEAVPKTIEDKWILTLLDKTIVEVTEALEELDFNKAAWGIYNFFWGEYCDWYLETIKSRMSKEDDTALQNAFYILKNILQLLHPFMPFITEELWQKLPFDSLKESIMISEWPSTNGYNFTQEYEDFELLKKLIQSVRQIKSELAISEELSLMVDGSKEDVVTLLKNNIEILRSLGGIEEIGFAAGQKGIPIIIGSYHFLIPLKDEGLINKMIADFNAEIEDLEKLLSDVERKLSNPDFLSKAPESVVQKEQEKKLNFSLKIEKLRMYIEGLER